MYPRDRDFIETTDGLLFCVVGYLHPEDGYTAYLKYIPSEKGKWERDGVRYTRSLPYYHVSQVENTYDWLKHEHPEYILSCPVRNIEISWVPKNKVRKYYQPLKRVKDLKKDGSRDILEEKLLRQVQMTEEKAGISDCIGVTGSILTQTHNPDFSDIDLTVYGLDNSYKLMKAIQKLEGKNGFRGITQEEKEEWVKNRVEKHGLDRDTLKLIAEKRWNYGYFDGTYFSVHPIRAENEIAERYGDNIYNRVSTVSGTATVTDTSESILLPAIYKIEDRDNPEITEITSFEGLYGGVFSKGDEITYRGVLEQVKGKNPHYRVLIGGAGSPESIIKWSHSG